MGDSLVLPGHHHLVRLGLAQHLITSMYLVRYCCFDVDAVGGGGGGGGRCRGFTAGDENRRAWSNDMVLLCIRLYFEWHRSVRGSVTSGIMLVDAYLAPRTSHHHSVQLVFCFEIILSEGTRQEQPRGSTARPERNRRSQWEVGSGRAIKVDTCTVKGNRRLSPPRLIDQFQDTRYVVLHICGGL